MARARRTANHVRKQILEGVSDYAEWRTEMAAAAENRRREESRRRGEARCGTVCSEFPQAGLATMLELSPAKAARDAQAAMLN